MPKPKPKPKKKKHWHNNNSLELKLIHCCSEKTSSKQIYLQQQRVSQRRYSPKPKVQQKAWFGNLLKPTPSLPLSLSLSLSPLSHHVPFGIPSQDGISLWSMLSLPELPLLFCGYTPFHMYCSFKWRTSHARRLPS
jgi:hypothetical protein